MDNPNIDFSGKLDKSLEERGFPTNWDKMSEGQLLDHQPQIKEILDNVSVNQDWNSHRDKVESLTNRKEKNKSEEQRLQLEIENLQRKTPSDEQRLALQTKSKELEDRQRLTRSLRRELDLEMHHYELEEHNYKELMDIKGMLENKLRHRGVKFDS